MAAQQTWILCRWNNDSTSDGFEIETPTRSEAKFAAGTDLVLLDIVLSFCCIFIVTLLDEFVNFSFVCFVCAFGTSVVCVYFSA